MKSFTGSGFDHEYTTRDSGLDCKRRSGIRQNLSDGCRKENDVRDSVWMRDFRVKGAGMLDLDPLYRFFVYIMTNLPNNSRPDMPRCVSPSVSSFGIKGTVCLKTLFFVDFHPFS